MIKPVSSESSFAKKAAVAVGTVAVVGSAIYAARKGQVPDGFEASKARQVAVKMGDGYKKLGASVADKAVKGFKFVKAKAEDAMGKLAVRLRPAARKGEEVASEAL